jgi:hypothetical protein
MRKRIIPAVPKPRNLGQAEWFDLDQLATVEITSEDPAHPIEAALLPGIGLGWRAAQAGVQTLRLVFDSPQNVKLIHLVFTEEQELTPSSHSLFFRTQSMSTNSQDRIDQLKTQLASLEKAAVQELIDRRKNIVLELATVDAQIAKLTGKPVKEKIPRTPASHGRNISLQQLKDELAAAPNKTLNIRKANLELRNIKVLAEYNPGLLKLGGVGAWPTVTLLGPTKSKLHPLEPELG